MVASITSRTREPGRGVAIGVTLYDCPWCGSAKSIEHGLCQICLMEFSVETKVITLPTTHPAFSREPVATQGAANAEPS